MIRRIRHHIQRAVFVLVLFFPVSVLAAPQYSVAPLVITEDVEARDILTHDITITNTGSQPVTVYPTVNNISLTEGGRIEEFVQRVESEKDASLAAWIEISRRGVLLPVGESRTVTMTLRIHPEPQPGEYHAFVGFGHGRNRNAAEQQVRTGEAPGSIVTVRVVDERVEALRLGTFVIDKFVTSGENKAITYTITNPGDTPLTPKGDILLYTSTGEEAGAIPVNPDNVTIDPGGEHTFTAAVPSDGLFGRYKAYLSVDYGVSNLASVNDTAFFYALPLKLLLLIGAVIILLVGAVAWWYHKRYLDEDDLDDADPLHLHVREGLSDPKEHDIDLKAR